MTEENRKSLKTNKRSERSHTKYFWTTIKNQYRFPWNLQWLILQIAVGKRKGQVELRYPINSKSKKRRKGGKRSKRRKRRPRMLRRRRRAPELTPVEPTPCGVRLPL